MSIWNQNAAAFTSKASAAVDARRHAGVRDAHDLIRQGRAEEAQYQLIRSVQSQVRMAGLTGAVIPLCACGEGCTHVVVGAVL